MMKLIHIAEGTATTRIWTRLFIEKLNELGDLRLIDNGIELPRDALIAALREADICLLGWEGLRIPDEIADDPGSLKYFCGITGTMSPYVTEAHLSSGIPLTNWSVHSPTQGYGVAQKAMALLLAALQDLHHCIQLARQSSSAPLENIRIDELYDMPVGIYGCGQIARKFITMLQAFGPVIRVFDPYMDQPPEGCERVETLEDLFSSSKAVVIHAGLTPETRNSVTAGHLSLLPDHAVVVNTARGGIIDQDALFAELRSGRLRAGLDVLEPDDLPDGHEARRWENLIWTAHGQFRRISPSTAGEENLSEFQEICLRNIVHFLNGEPLEGVMDLERFRRST